MAALAYRPAFSFSLYAGLRSYSRWDQSHIVAPWTTDIVSSRPAV